MFHLFSVPSYFPQHSICKNLYSSSSSRKTAQTRVLSSSPTLGKTFSVFFFFFSFSLLLVLSYSHKNNKDKNNETTGSFWSGWTKNEHKITTRWKHWLWRHAGLNTITFGVFRVLNFWPLPLQIWLTVNSFFPF